MPNLEYNFYINYQTLLDFQKIAENWDSMSEYAQGKLDGVISAFASIYGCRKEENRVC